MLSKKHQKSLKSQESLERLREWFGAVRSADIVAGLACVNKKLIPSLNCVDPDDSCQPTALIVAAQLNRFAFTKKVLLGDDVLKKNFLEINKTDRNGRHALWYAVVNDNGALLRLLLENGADINYADRETGMTPLYLSVVLERTEICQQLIIGGANVNLHRLDPTKPRRTPLIESVVVGNEAIAAMLLNAFCDIKLTTSYGYNALHYAVACRRYETLKIMLQRTKSLVHSESLHGCTAMTIAIDQELPSVIKLLIQDGGYDVNRPYRWHETPLDQAIKIYAESCAIALVLNGSSINRNHHQEAVQLGLKNLAFLLKRFAIIDRVGSLKELCRVKICFLLRQHRALCELIVKDEICLPGLSEECRSYLLFEKETKRFEKIYERKDLGEARCPFDCDSDCLERLCPILEPSF